VRLKGQQAALHDPHVLVVPEEADEDGLRPGAPEQRQRRLLRVRDLLGRAQAPWPLRAFKRIRAWEGASRQAVAPHLSGPP